VPNLMCLWFKRWTTPPLSILPFFNCVVDPSRLSLCCAGPCWLSMAQCWALTCCLCLEASP
jgi:hypothetical protein